MIDWVLPMLTPASLPVPGVAGNLPLPMLEFPTELAGLSPLTKGLMKCSWPILVEEGPGRKAEDLAAGDCL